MAKTIKKKVTAKTDTKSEDSRELAPTIGSGFINVAMVPSDLAVLANLMSVCAKIFEEQANIAAQQNDEPRFTILNARHKLSVQFADRFVEFYKMGEPESRDMH